MLDEADRLLDQGFRKELIKILETLPERTSVDRQTLLFTATVPEGIRKVRLDPFPKRRRAHARLHPLRSSRIISSSRL